MFRDGKRSGWLLSSALPIGAFVVVLGMKATQMPTTSAAVVDDTKVSDTAETMGPKPQTKTASKSKNLKSATELTDFTSGPRSSEEIDEEWALWTSSENPIHLGAVTIEEDMHLTAILTEFQDPSKNSLRVLHIQTLTDTKQKGPDSVTLYNRPIDGLEEKILKMGLIVPHQLRKSNAGLVQSKADNSFYQVKMNQSILKRPFDLRPPVAMSEFSNAVETDFDPIGLFLLETTQDGEITNENFEVLANFGDEKYTVQAEARETEFGTLVIELRIRALDSLSTKKIALIYE